MKKKVFFYLIFIVLFLVLQTTLLHYIKIHGVMPNLLITFIIVTALIRNSTEGAAVGFFSGLCIDLQFGPVIGFRALLGFFLGLAAGSVNRRIFRENLMVVIFFSFIYSVAYESVIFIINNIMTGDIRFVFAMTKVILPEALYNSVMSVLLFPLLVKAGKRFGMSAAAVRKY
jgi:rod shape-determining protein MreD